MSDLLARALPRLVLGCVLFLSSVALALGQEEVEEALPSQPNVLLFLVDDLGWQDTSVPFHVDPTPFNARYRTPAMERLAAEGMSFTNAYAASPVCTPTRVSLLTGRNPARHHITNWILHEGRDQTAKHATLRPPTWNVNGLQPGDVTLPGLLREAGYRTIHVGKAHLGAKGTPGEDPLNLGFDRNVGGHGAGGPGSHYGRDHFSATRRGRNPSKSAVWDVPGLEAYHGKDVYLTEALTLEARKLVAEAVEDGVPFFLHMAHYAVHAPIMADPRYVERYADLDPREAAYASMVEGVDASLGALLDQLDELGVAEDTVVLFMSDNGGLSAHGRGGERHTHNAPLRSGKGSSHEGGIRVPMIVRWPGAVAPGSRCTAPVISDDFFPTILAMAGVATPAEHVPEVDGLDVTPFLRGEAGTDRDRVLGWHYPHQWGAPGPGIEPFSAVRQGPWKLIWFHADGRLELYDLDRDPGETHDLAAERPTVRERMTGVLRAWLLREGAATSVVKETGEAVPPPSASKETR